MSQTLTRHLWRHLPTPLLKTPLRRNSTFDLKQLKSSMLARRAPILYDYLTPSNTFKLEKSLQSFLPREWTSSPATLPPASIHAHQTLPPAHHLVYFNPAIPEHELLPDGTDPLQSPGQPFVRRMWAGGTVKYNPRFVGDVRLDGRRWVCHEFVRDVQVRGKEGDEKVFVGIERRFGPAELLSEGGEQEVDERVRKLLWSEEAEGLDGEDGEYTAFVETRNIVFMRERSEAEMEKLKAGMDKPELGKNLKRRLASTPLNSAPQVLYEV